MPSNLAGAYDSARWKAPTDAGPLSTVRTADRIFVLKDGRTVEAGTHAELVARENGVYRTLSELQFDLTSPRPAPGAKEDEDQWLTPLTRTETPTGPR